jgi:hypothetical protein
MELVATDAAPGAYTAIGKWIAQNALYQAVQGDAVLNDDNTVTYEYPTDSSSILNTFYTMAQNSRYKYLADVDYYLTAGALDSAQALMDSKPGGYTATDEQTGVVIADSGNADHIVANYDKYFGINIRYQNRTATTSDNNDLLSLASLCPYTNGEVVYKARVLYSMAVDSVIVWQDDSLCSSSGNQPQGRMARGNSGAAMAGPQAYSLHPNPNNGYMTVWQAQDDAMPVQAQVWNANGQMLYSAAITFSGRQATVDIGNAVPGLYLLQLRDNAGNNYALKFIVH